MQDGSSSRRTASAPSGAAGAAVRARPGRAAGGDAASRSAQVGTGKRARKIRTYNLPDKRVKDHRINLLVHNLDEILFGSLDEMTSALQDDEETPALAGARKWLRRSPRPASRFARRSAARPRHSSSPGATRPGLTLSCCWPRRSGRPARLVIDADEWFGARRPVRLHELDRAAGGTGAGRLHPRLQGVPAHVARGRSTRADSAPRDRAAGRGGVDACARRAGRRCRHGQWCRCARAEGRAPRPAA